MRYKWFRSRGLLAGSGVAEAGCKAILTTALRLSGMRRTVPDADAIITLRCHEATSKREQIWQRPRSQTATT